MTNRDGRQRRAPFRHRRRGRLGFSYRQACAVLRPELLAKLPERGRDEAALFDLDHVSYTP